MNRQQDNFIIITVDNLDIAPPIRSGPESALLEICAAADTQVATSVTDERRLLYDRKAAALQLSISVRTLDYLIANKKLDTRRIGKKVLVPRAELVRFARSGHLGPAKDSPDF